MTIVLCDLDVLVVMWGFTFLNEVLNPQSLAASITKNISWVLKKLLRCGR